MKDIPTHIALDGFFMQWWIDEGMPTKNLSPIESSCLLLCHRAYNAARTKFEDQD